MDRILNERDNECTTSHLDTEKTMPSASSPQWHTANLSTPQEIEHAPLNSPTNSVSSVITISDSDDDVIIIQSDDQKNEVLERMKYIERYNRRVKYKIRRAINIILRYHTNFLTEEEKLYFERKKDQLRCKRSNKVVNRAPTVKSAQSPMSEDRNIRRVESLRRRFFEAIRTSHEFMTVWSSDRMLNNSSFQTAEYMQWMDNCILKESNIPVTRDINGEIISNELDSLIDNFDGSDTESSSGSEISTTYCKSGRNHLSSKSSDDGQHSATFFNQNKTRRRNYTLRYHKYLLRLQRRQQLRDRFKKMHQQCFNGEDQTLKTSQTEHFEVEKELRNNKDGIQNSTLTSSPCGYQTSNTNDNVDEATNVKETIQVIQVDSDSEPSDSSSCDEQYIYRQNVQGSSHTNDILYPPTHVKSSGSALSSSVEGRVRWAEKMASEIVSRRKITTEPPPGIPISDDQISTIELHKSTRNTHRIHLDPSKLMNDDELTSQQEPGFSVRPDDVCVSPLQQQKQPSPPIIVITPASDGPESCITEELPYQRNKRVVEINSLSSEAATPSHAIKNNLLAPPVMRVKRRSRSRTRDPRRPRRFCSPSPPKSRTRIITSEQTRGRSRSPLTGPRTPTRPLVNTNPRLSPQLPRSPPTSTTTTSTASATATTTSIASAAATATSDISASTVATTGATAERLNLSPSPLEALKSTLQQASTDDSATATLSQAAFALLQFSGQSPRSDNTINTCVVDNHTLQTTGTHITVVTAAAADDDSMSNSDVLRTIAVGGGGLARNPATKRQRSRDRSNSPLNAQKLKPTSSSNGEQQPNK